MFHLVDRCSTLRLAALLAALLSMPHSLCVSPLPAADLIKLSNDDLVLNLSVPPHQVAAKHSSTVACLAEGQLRQAASTRRVRNLGACRHHTSSQRCPD